MFHKRHYVRHGKTSGLNSFPPLPDIWVQSWGHPHPHEGPQHQQGQGLILEHIGSLTVEPDVYL